MDYERDFVLEGVIRDWFSDRDRRIRYMLDESMHGALQADVLLFNDMQEENLVGPDEFDQFMLSYSEYSKSL